MGSMTKGCPRIPGDPPMLQGAPLPPDPPTPAFHPRPCHWKAPSLPWRKEVPESMPWSSASGGFMTFTGSMMASSRQSDPPGMVTIKRHSEKEGEGPSHKHFLSEEGMAARFTCLSLSNDHVYGSNGFPVARGQLHTDKERHFQDLERRSDPPGMVTIKRHSEKEGEGPSRKHFLSEEGMAARFTCLSLSNDHVYGSNGFPVARGHLHTDKEHHFQDLERRIVLGGDEWGTDSAEKKDVIVEGMFDMSDSRVIVVSSAIQRRLESPLEDILPREVLWSMSHPCTELILWQPPGNVIQRAIRALRLDGERRGPGQERGIETDPDADTRQSAGGLQRPEDEMEL